MTTATTFIHTIQVEEEEEKKTSIESKIIEDIYLYIQFLNKCAIAKVAKL